MSTIYENGTYLKNTQTWHEEDSAWKAEQIIHIIKKNGINPSNICEVGCGAGEILNYMVNYYNNKIMCYGYDISPFAYEICKKKEKSNLKFYLKDILNENDIYFDVLMAIDVFEHVEDYFGFLRKIRNLGEYKVFHIPLGISVQAVLRGTPIIEARKKVGHIHVFNKEMALATLEDTGYEILDYYYTKGSLELPNIGWKAKLLRLPRRALFKINPDFTSKMLGGFSLLVLAK